MSAGNCFELNFELGRTTLGSSCDFRTGLGWPWNLHGISSQFQRLCEGTFLGQDGRRGLLGFHASWRKTLSPYCQGAPPSAPCPQFLSEIGKDQRALTEPKGLPSCPGAWESLEKEK